MRYILYLLLSLSCFGQEFDSLKTITGTVGLWYADENTTIANWGNSSAGSGAAFVQGNASLQPTLQASADGLSSHAALDFAATDYMRSGSAGDYNFIHNGSGATIVFVAYNTDLSVTQNKVILQDGLASGTGFVMNFQSISTTQENFIFTVWGAGSVVILNAQTNVPTGWVIGIVTFKNNSGTNDFKMKLNNATIVKANATVANISAADHSNILTTNHPTVFNQSIGAELAYLQILNREASDAEMTQIYASLYKRYFTSFNFNASNDKNGFGGYSGKYKGWGKY